MRVFLLRRTCGHVLSLNSYWLTYLESEPRRLRSRRRHTQDEVRHQVRCEEREVFGATQRDHRVPQPAIDGRPAAEHVDIEDIL